MPKGLTHQPPYPPNPNFPKKVIISFWQLDQFLALLEKIAFFLLKKPKTLAVVHAKCQASRSLMLFYILHFANTSVNWGIIKFL